MNLPPLFNKNFPSYYRECFNSCVDILWYHPKFSQSQYPPGQEGSEACTLICLLLARRICENDIIIWEIDKCYELIISIAEAIVEGNETHAWIMEQRLVPYAYLNTEEALKYGGRSLRMLKEWTFHVYREDIAEGLFQNIRSYLHKWYQEPRNENLFMLLITSGRTIVFIFQETTFKVTLFDSHTHNASSSAPRGLVVAQTSFDQLESLCEWYVRYVLINCYKIQPEQYELAFVYQYKQTRCGYGNSAGCNCRR